MRNSTEHLPLISTASHEDCELDTISMPSLSSTTPPPYSDRGATPRPPTIHRVPTPPTITSASDDKPILNIYADGIDAGSIQDLFERYRKTGDVAPTINLHVSSNGGSSGAMLEMGMGEGSQAGGAKDLEAGGKRKKKDERFGLVLGHVTGVFGMVLAGFIVWAIMQGVVKITRA